MGYISSEMGTVKLVFGGGDCSEYWKLVLPYLNDFIDFIFIHLLSK